MVLLYIALVIFAVVIVVQAIVLLRLATLRRAGIHPAKGQATMADVERLFRSGRRIWAIRCYREIHKCGLAQAKKAVDGLHSVAE